MDTMSTPQPTPETNLFMDGLHGYSASWEQFAQQVKDFACKLKRERDEMREELQQWKMLCAWGGTPEHIEQFIKGQQIRIHQAQDIEETCEQLERERDEAREQLEAMREAIREVFNSFADEDSAWLLDDLQTAALAKLKPFLAHE